MKLSRELPRSLNPQRLTSLFWLRALAFLGLVHAANAATFAVVLSDNTEPYQEVADGLEGRLGAEHTVVRILASQLGQSESAIGKARLVVSVGVEATRKLAERRGNPPVLAVLIPKAWYEAEGRSVLANGNRESGAIFIDQPLGRQFHLIRSAFPSVKRVGVVLGGKTVNRLPELEREARTHRLTLVSAPVDSSGGLIEKFEDVLHDAEILLLPFPDPEVLTRSTAQSILMTSYRYRDPVIGYSQSLSKAGALLAIYSNPAQIGRQAAELLERTLRGERLPDPLWPQYFSISVNTHVARALGLGVPSEAVLMRSVQEAETRSHD